MRIFDKIDPENIQRRERQLTILICTTILILTAGLVLFMYPVVFSHAAGPGPWVQRTGFYGFCALSLLLVAYLLSRQGTIHELRRQILEDQRRIFNLQIQDNEDLLMALPGLSHFQDRLMMEYRRASSAEKPLSVVVVELKPAGKSPEASEATLAWGDAAKAMFGKLRGEDSIYRFGSGFFGVVLPDVDPANAQRVASRLTSAIQSRTSVQAHFSPVAHVFNYPDHAATARELEEAVCSLLPEDLLELVESEKVS